MKLAIKAGHLDMKATTLWMAIFALGCTSAEPANPFADEFPLVDMRDWASEVTEQNAPSEEEARSQNDRFLQAVARRADRAGVDLSRTGTGRQLMSAVSALPPPPGGVGYGYFYEDAEFGWTNETMLVQDLVAPRRPSGDVFTWLYNTATNRSELGVEAFVSYFGQLDFEFKVFDWARFPADPWQVALRYTELGDYLGLAESPDGVFRQEITLANRTALVAAPTDWVNQVYLLNRVTKSWDLVYEYAYSTAYATENTFELGDFYGSWGPIFETFQDHDGSNLPIGSNVSYLVQDGVQYDLTATNSVLRVDDPDLDPPVFNSGVSYGYAVGDTTLEPVETNLEAESGSQSLGAAAGRGWIARPADGVGVMVSHAAVGTGTRWAIDVELAVRSLSASGTHLATVEVWDDTQGVLVASLDIYDDDFAVARSTRPFRLAFESVLGNDYRFDVVTMAAQPIFADRIALAAI